MGNNAAIREFKKYKSQIHQMKEVAEHSKPGALIEQESAIRKKLKKLKEFEKTGLKDFDEVYESYEELLEYVSEKMLKDYNKKNNTHHFASVTLYLDLKKLI